MAENPVAAAAKTPAKAGAWLQGRMFGMPRWLFLSLAAGGIGIGLYFRSRQAAEPTEEEYVEEDVLADGGIVDGFEDPGLAGAGLGGTGFVGPMAGSVMPVQAPVIPEGIPEIIDVLGGVIGGLAEGYAPVGGGTNQPAVDTGGSGTGDAGYGGGPVVDLPTGGGSPGGAQPNRVIGHATKQEVKRLDNPLAKAVLKAEKTGGGITKAEQKKLVQKADSPQEKKQVRKIIRTGQGAGK